LSAALIASAAVMVVAAPQSHAAPAASHARMCVWTCRALPPTLTTYGHYGEVNITGAHWTPSWNLEVYVYLPVSAGGGVSWFAAFTDKYGNLNTYWLAPSGCFNQQVEVQVYDSKLNKVLTSYAVPGCIG
ncbi:MAG TPA: hypothetical protein VHB98_21740, partial [Chloroflexota bacterium]|nr:hypothetical protein [Chloroflexota bacterium]